VLGKIADLQAEISPNLVVQISRATSEATQIKLFVDTLVKTHPGYEEVIENNVYRKR